MEPVLIAARGTIISIHQLGATARLEDGSLAAISAAELTTHRPVYVSSRDRRAAIDLHVDRSGRHPVAALVAGAPGAEATGPPVPSQFADLAFEQRLGAYLKATQEWAPSDRPPPAERHFTRKKRRANFFEARKKNA